MSECSQCKLVAKVVRMVFGEWPLLHVIPLSLSTVSYVPIHCHCPQKGKKWSKKDQKKKITHEIIIPLQVKQVLFFTKTTPQKNLLLYWYIGHVSNYPTIVTFFLCFSFKNCTSCLHFLLKRLYFVLRSSLKKNIGSKINVWHHVFIKRPHDV